MSKFYITAAIPYVNAKPHVGHALEFVQGDTIARYHKLIGEQVSYLSGSDENALKNVQAAEKAGMDIDTFCKTHADEFQSLAQKLSVSFDVFQRSSSKEHHQSSQALWKRCAENGDIYKHTYTGLYCVGCEAFYTLDELDENQECYEHPGKKLEEISEENYFFKLSTYKDQILSFIESNQLRILPESRKNEVIGFLKGEVRDISISRSRSRAKNWGVEVPGDPDHMMYVWFDALNVYQSGVGFGFDEEQYNTWWPADVHLIGKGILRFHAVYWPAILLSAKLPLPKQINVHGYFTVNGQKMSKTLGNVIDPIELVNTFGAEALRYYFLREIPSTEDGDFSVQRLRDAYDSQLANELGNLVSRLSKLCEGLTLSSMKVPLTCSPTIVQAFQDFTLKSAMDDIWNRISEINKQITIDKPWEKQGDERVTLVKPLIETLHQIGYDLQPFMPTTASKILSIFGSETITPAQALFPRLQKQS